MAGLIGKKKTDSFKGIHEGYAARLQAKVGDIPG